MTAGGPPSDQADLWLVVLDAAAGDPALAERHRALMSAEERDRERAYLDRDSQLAHRVARALVRTTLARYAAVAPLELEFTAGPLGRPEIHRPPGARRLRFNLSHSRGLVACLVARDRAVGVDAEDTARAADLDGLARRHFAPAEQAQLFALPPGPRRLRFFELWTLKEAYLKARGVGLSLPLERFAFDLSGVRPTVTFAPPIADQPARWQFDLHRVGSSHAVATAIELTGDRPVEVRVQQMGPDLR